MALSHRAIAQSAGPRRAVLSIPRSASAAPVHTAMRRNLRGLIPMAAAAPATAPQTGGTNGTVRHDRRRRPALAAHFWPLIRRATHDIEVNLGAADTAGACKARTERADCCEPSGRVRAMCCPGADPKPAAHPLSRRLRATDTATAMCRSCIA